MPSTAARVGQDVARGTAGELALQLGDPALELALLRDSSFSSFARASSSLALQQRARSASSACSRVAPSRARPPRSTASMRRTPAATPLSPRSLNEADVAGARHVRAAAQLGRELAHAHHAHAVAVLVAEERQRARLDGVVVRHLLVA